MFHARHRSAYETPGSFFNACVFLTGLLDVNVDKFTSICLVEGHGNSSSTCNIQADEQRLAGNHIYPGLLQFLNKRQKCQFNENILSDEFI